tara:strand:- start:27369 stop:27785 length:417 start_codon:yes stop_codon:yes gene_type:complete
MSSIVFDIAEFRIRYPRFDGISNDVVLRAFESAEMFVSNNTSYYLNESRLKYVLYIMTAHIIQIGVDTASNGGGSAGIVSSTSIDKISVSFEDRLNNTAFQYFLNKTIYGEEILALFSLWSVGGYYVGGSNATLGFKR